MAYNTHDLSDTIVALATPQGVGAIGVIRLSGKDAIKIVDRVFKGKKLAEQDSHTVHFGTIRDREDRIIDEVLVTLFVAPRSYTGENVVEVSCHGSDYIIQQLIQLFIDEGARLAQPGEFTMRAFLNGRMDLSQAEAVADLIASSSAASHELAMRQMRGGFSAEIGKLRQELIDFASLIELELDFGEEDVEFANRDDLKALVHKIQGVLRQLIQSFQLGNVIKQGVTTVIAGRPNAGKSTLLNALLNEERAIVSDIAGTTRDTIEEVLNIKGVQFRLVDTAGIREATDTIEAIGVEKTLEKVRQSSLLLYVFDVVNTSPEEVRADLNRLIQPGMHVLVVANKMDLNPYTKFEDYFQPTPDPSRSREGRSSDTPSPEREGRGGSIDHRTYEKLWGWRSANPRAYGRLKTFAGEMRKEQTPAEKLLWERLRKRQVAGHKFLRQHIIGTFIADFYCAEKKLVIEVDGAYHQLPEVKLSDEQRTAVLEANGCRVLRFSNEQVTSQPDEVIAAIEKALHEALPSLEGRDGGGSMVAPENWVPIIAREGMNIPYLKDKLYEAVLREQVQIDQTIVSNARHYEALEKAYQALDDVLKGMAAGITSDFVAMDIRRALHHLGEITGEISTDDLLGNIFGKFCIGK
ncbi:MAG: tRNA uridine-5-carboxymethylaminomethyl(34) synthesis GTPase MnmE [Bacteroidetes bacterium]|nr:MAG: tRNA uridine-5-carboxymethylaminomethyl(34) synthesis GTPase MnmE [Bacteroidota bacterium]